MDYYFGDAKKNAVSSIEIAIFAGTFAFYFYLSIITGLMLARYSQIEYGYIKYHCLPGVDPQKIENKYNGVLPNDKNVILFFIVLLLVITGLRLLHYKLHIKKDEDTSANFSFKFSKFFVNFMGYLYPTFATFFYHYYDALIYDDCIKSKNENLTNFLFQATFMFTVCLTFTLISWLQIRCLPSLIFFNNILAVIGCLYILAFMLLLCANIYFTFGMGFVIGGTINFIDIVYMSIALSLRKSFRLKEVKKDALEKLNNSNA